MEPVNKIHVVALHTTPDIDTHRLSVKPCVAGATPSDLVQVDVYNGKSMVASGKSINGEEVSLDMPENAKLWSPESPFLYDIKVTVKRDGKVVDEVSGYTAMRTSKAFVMAEPPYNVPLLEGTS